MGTEEQCAQRDSENRGTLGTEEHRGPAGVAGKKEQLGTEEQWAQRNVRHRGTQGTEEQ